MDGIKTLENAAPQAAAEAGIYPPLPAEAVAEHKPREPFTVTRADSWFALACLALGYLFVRWGVQFSGYGTAAFTGVYIGAVLVYARAKCIRPAPASWFWLAILALTGAAFALWPGGSVQMWRSLLLFAVAVYWPAAMMGGLLERKTGNFIVLDGINLLFMVPFRNLGTWFKALGGFRCEKPEKAEKSKHIKFILYVMLGLLLSVPVIALVLPMLMTADAGGFSQMMAWLGDWLKDLFSVDVLEELAWAIAGFPVALYLCGLIAGLAHRRYIDSFDIKNTRKTLAGMRITPVATVITAMAAVCLLYTIFIGSQLPYYFSAFGGQRPEGYEVYSAYARDGFFELCRIAAINLLLLVLAWGLSKKKRQSSRLLSGFSIALTALTLLLIATAFSKMALYIGAYGLTARRVLVCVFLVFLAVVCVAIVVAQFRPVVILRVAAASGALLLCGLALCNVDGLIARYNAARHMAGSPTDYDDYNYSNLYYYGGIVSAEALLEVARGSDSTVERARLLEKVKFATAYANSSKGKSYDCASSAMLRKLRMTEAEMEAAGK